jgi:hypothetical protein
MTTLIFLSLFLTYSSYYVLTGFDGGMNQTFHILVKEKGSELVKYDNSNLDKGGGRRTKHCILSYYYYTVHSGIFIFL